MEFVIDLPPAQRLEQIRPHPFRKLALMNGYVGKRHAVLFRPIVPLTQALDLFSSSLLLCS
jgi:hypothetical protein